MLTNILIVVGVLCLGVVIGFLASSLIAKKSAMALREEVAKEKAEMNYKLLEAMKTSGKAEELVSSKASLEQKLAELESVNNRLNRDISNLNVQKAEFAKSQEHLQAEQAKLLEDKNKLLETYKSEFKNVANEILKQQTEQFKTTNKSELGHIISPLNDKLADFQKRIQEYRESQTKDKADLVNQVGNVIKANSDIESITRDFVNALHGESGVRGAWGEETLRTLLNASGFEEGVNYFEQYQKDDKRPDFIVRLPNNKMIVIDAKTIFNNYEHYINETDPKEKKKYLEAHVKDLKNTIQDLGSKKYKTNAQKICKELNIPEDDSAIEYVLMWVNPENAIIAAAKEAPEIVGQAFDKKVVLVSGSSLINTLKMINMLWVSYTSQERGEEIKDLAESLVYEFGNFLKSFLEVRKYLDKALAAHEDVTKTVGENDKSGLIAKAQELANIYPTRISQKAESVIEGMGYAYDGKGKNGALLTEDKSSGNTKPEKPKSE